MALPPKAKITALVCRGRRRPKLICGRPRLNFQLANSKAAQRPANMPTAPQNEVARRNQRVILSSYLIVIMANLGGWGLHARYSGYRAIRIQRGIPRFL